MWGGGGVAGGDGDLRGGGRSGCGWGGMGALHGEGGRQGQKVIRDRIPPHVQIGGKNQYLVI